MVRIIVLTITAMAASVLAGWWAEIPSFVQMSPEWAACQPWTAVGFLIACAAVLQPRLRLVLGKVLGLLGIAVLIEYASGVTIPGFDTLWSHAWNLVRTSHPGRMSPATAIGFCFASAYLTATCPRYKQGWAVTVGLLGVMAVVGYWTGLELYRWGEFTTDMSLRTGAMFSALGWAFLLEMEDCENAVAEGVESD